MANKPSPPARVALSQIIYASAQMLQAVREGRSLSGSFVQVAPELRAATQSVTFHVMRQYGLANEIKQILVARTPPNALFDAIMVVAIALLDSALEARDNPQAVTVRSVPVYAVHTVVDQAVRLVAGRRPLQAYKGLLNGVLRQFGRKRTAILQQALENSVAKYNHPQWWIDLLRKAYPDCWEDLLAAANQPGPMTLRVNVRRQSVARVQRLFDDAGIASQVVGQSGLVLMQPRPVHEVPGFDEGWWSVQDAAAQMAAEILQPADDLSILDACAAPGGKAAHLLEQADVTLTALDADSDRLQKIRQTLNRLGLADRRVHLLCADAARPDQWWDGQSFDAVLADVPCTASGVVRRHPDIRWLRREADVERTARLQRSIVEAVWKTVRPGGRMLYATCSLFPQEGEQQADWFLAAHPEARRLPAPGQLLPLASDGLASLYDGFFYALFVRQA